MAPLGWAGLLGFWLPASEIEPKLHGPLISRPVLPAIKAKTIGPNAGGAGKWVAQIEGGQDEEKYFGFQKEKPMRKGGRFGKYGEQKRLERLRQSRSHKVKMLQEPRKGKNLRGFIRPTQEEKPEGVKDQAGLPSTIRQNSRA